MVKNLKKIFSIFLSVVLIALMLVPFVSAVAYPKDVTKEKAETAIEKTDGVIYNAVMALQNTTLKALIAKEITPQTLFQCFLQVFTECSAKMKQSFRE